MSDVLTTPCELIDADLDLVAGGQLFPYNHIPSNFLEQEEAVLKYYAHGLVPIIAEFIRACSSLPPRS